MLQAADREPLSCWFAFRSGNGFLNMWNRWSSAPGLLTFIVQVKLPRNLILKQCDNATENLCVQGLE